MEKEAKENKVENKPKSEIAKIEEQILEFWQKNDIFEKSLAKPSKGDFVFYDGPPFATGLPHYGHLLAGTIKDAIPRYQTMQGKKVLRRWGWDCHGLPIENLVSKELGLKTREDIEKIGVKKFNEHARDSVLRYDREWKVVVPRFGRFVDMNNAYKTMDSDYMESVLAVFKKLYDKGLVYEGFKSMHICPELETPLSNFEVNQNYKDITDISVFVIFPIKGDEKTSFLAWTTTPWTLPGNVALAVGKDINYVKIEKEGKKYILAKDRIEALAEHLGDFEIVEEMKGADLEGTEYLPPFDAYYKAGAGQIENHKNGWRVYAADFVTTEDGTGIVHIAPAFGEDDLNLGNEKSLPFVQHVGINGVIYEDVPELAGLQAKPKDDHQSTDIEVIKILAHSDRLFAKEKIIHSYPHCWRTDAPLLNYAMSSWFVKTTDLREKMIRNNKRVNWIPENIGEGRFGKWLEGIKDWAISRNRYWGAPLPIWRSENGKYIEVLGSTEDIRNKTRGDNRYVVMRHGEAENNTKEILDYKDPNVGLTEEGKKQNINAAAKIKKYGIDLIISSPVRRTKETAQIVAKELGLPEDSVIEDARISEVDTGDLQGKPIEEYRKMFKNNEEKFYEPTPGGETLTEMKNRVGEFLYDIDKKYSEKNILIVTHEYGAWMLDSVRNGHDAQKSSEAKDKKGGNYVENAEFFELDFAPLPHNENYELDFHRPYIDDITWDSIDDGLMRRIPEVFDTWFDSGSMPYGQAHYPFENKKSFGGFFKKGTRFPADFIAEGLDQTRGWFYTLLVLGTALFNKSPYKNVIVNGLVLAEDGAKMSKSKNNFPDPMEVVDSYGADAIRFYMLSSPIVRAEDLAFTEKGVDEIMKKVVMRLYNTASFLEMYADENKKLPKPYDSKNVLDKWILARLAELRNEVTEAMDSYELDRATRPFLDFVDDFSTWYVRRSRDRFKDSGEDQDLATATLKFTLIETSKLLAPFMPFTAEHIYQKVRDENSLESVHLEDWPQEMKIDKAALELMQKTRDAVTQGLDARTSSGIRVRQPLAKLTLKDNSLENNPDYIEQIKEEVNVKAVEFDSSLENAAELDTQITDELKKEGTAREFIRLAQSMRKKAGLQPKDQVEFEVKVSEEIKSAIETNIDEIQSTIGSKKINFVADLEAEEFEIGDQKVSISIK